MGTDQNERYNELIGSIVGKEMEREPMEHVVRKWHVDLGPNVDLLNHLGPRGYLAVFPKNLMVLAQTRWHCIESKPDKSQWRHWREEYTEWTDWTDNKNGNAKGRFDALAVNTTCPKCEQTFE